MAGPGSEDDFDVPAWAFTLGKLFGLGEITVRWRFIRLKRRLKWLRRELVPPSRGFEHQICPACGAVQDGRLGTCAACGERLGSKVTRTLRAVGLSIPSVVSVSSLLGLAMLGYVLCLPHIGPGASKPPHRPLHAASLYWHFVDAVWAIIVALLYVVPHLQRG